MKKSILFLLLTGFLFFQTSTAMATYTYEIGVGDKIKLTGLGAGSGGAFTWVADTNNDSKFEGNDYVWQSFCVEKNEYISLNNTYTVGELSYFAKNGGKGGAVNGEDQLSDETAWLFWQFSEGELSGYTSNYQGDLQDLIWFLEDEGADPNTNQTNTWRNAFLASGWENDGRVQVVNLKTLNGGHAQDQLIIGSYHAPEPGTMILLGFGLIGMAGIGRKKIKK